VVGRVALLVGVSAVGWVGFPFVPTPVKVMAILMPILAGVFVIAAALEPAKRRPPGQGG
jgi:TctA family transporter